MPPSPSLPCASAVTAPETMLRTRVLSAALLAPLVVVVALVGEPWLSLLVGLIVFLALVEVIGLLDAAGFEPPQVVAQRGRAYAVRSHAVSSRGKNLLRVVNSSVQQRNALICGSILALQIIVTA